MTLLARLPHAPARAFSTCGRGNARCNCLSGQRRVRMQPPISTCALALVASQPLPMLTPLPTQQPQQPQQPSSSSKVRHLGSGALSLSLSDARPSPERQGSHNKKARLDLGQTNRSLGAANALFDLWHSTLLLLLHPLLKHCAVGLCDSHLARLSVKAPTVDPNSYQTQPPA
jgi:hypothetical protein